MKKLIILAILLLLLLLTITSSIYAQDKNNIKPLLVKLEKNEKDPLPFYRKKDEWYISSLIGIKQHDKPISQKYIYSIRLNITTNYCGVPHYNFIDLNCTERIKNNTGVIVPPNLFKATKVFNSSKQRYIYIPFYIGVGDLCYEDVIIVCDENSGEIKDALLTCQMGLDETKTENLQNIVIRQWSLNENGEITVYELKIISDKKIYFRDAPSIMRMKRIDTTYNIDENGKFYVVSKKEYQPKDYKKEDLYQTGKEIWEGNEVPIP